jgi:hypothetical protein
VMGFAPLTHPTPSAQKERPPSGEDGPFQPNNQRPYRPRHRLDQAWISASAGILVTATVNRG